MLKLTNPYPNDFEHCCVCRVSTAFWYEEKDVPLCRICAEITEERKVPTKEKWNKTEEMYERLENLRDLAYNNHKNGSIFQ